MENKNTASTSTREAFNLGQRLFVLQSLKADEPQTKAKDDSFASEMRREVIETFFRNVRAYILHEIDNQRIPKSISFRSGGGMQSVPAADATPIFDFYSWKTPRFGEELSMPQGHLASRMWSEFSFWAERQGLHAHFSSDHDGMGVQSWLTLNISPAERFMRTVQLMERGSVIVPEDQIKKHGSAQAYVDHLEDLARKASAAH